MSRPRLDAIRPGILEYGKLTSLEVEVAAASGALLILPVGACEQHGDGLPSQPTASAPIMSPRRRLGDRRGRPEPAGVRPPDARLRDLPHHGNLPGTISLDPRIFIDTVVAIAGQLADVGFTRLLVVTGHGGNLAALGVASQVLLASHPQLAFAYSPVSGLATEATASLTRTEVSGHSGESETSQMLAIDDTLVDAAHLNPGATALDDLGPHARLSRTKSPTTAVTFEQYADNGVLGDPTTATAADGRRILAEVIAKLTSYARQMLAV